MGKDRRKNKQKKNSAEKRREKQKKKEEWKTMRRLYATIVRENNDFENYYKTQKIVPEDQWDSFMNSMKKNLPVAFRVTGSKVEAKKLMETIKEDFFEEILNIDTTNALQSSEDTKDILHCLPFYPDGLAWQLQLTRKDIRRSKAYFRLHNFLIVESENGNISRQEAVSMIPPLVLDVKPFHKVLDMCAAPGSKTSQIIELIHSEDGDALPEGIVVANELEHDRCFMLVHQAKRLHSPHIVITNHDASVLPDFTTTKPDGEKEEFKFDRILADVPCSGDGTMRKNPDIWYKWSPANGNNLHGVQYRIAKRGLELLAVGGRMVYSTCSLNPIENEAVLHRLLLETQDSVQLVDCRDLVTGLVCDPGISHWMPASKDLQYYKSWEDVPEQWQTQVHPKMFPPKPEDAAKFHFERCMRILPHHQDTGGFFVAVLEKVKHLPWERESHTDKLILEEEITEAGKRSSELSKARGKRKKRKRPSGHKDFGFFNDSTEEAWLSIKNFYDMSDELNPRCLLVRYMNKRRKNNIYFTSPGIRNVVLSNLDQIKFINAGVKSFVCYNNENMSCPYRVAHEGIHSIGKYVGDTRRIRLSKEELITLLQNQNPSMPPEIANLKPETQERLKTFEVGSCVLIYEEDNTENPLKLQMVGWRGTMSLRAYVTLHNAIHYLRLLGADCSQYEKEKLEESRYATLAEANNGVHGIVDKLAKEDGKNIIVHDELSDGSSMDTETINDEASVEMETVNDLASNDVNIKVEIANDDLCDEVSVEKETTNDEASNDVNIKIELANDDPCDEVSREKETTNDEASNDVYIKIEIANDDPCDEVSREKETTNDEASNDVYIKMEIANEDSCDEVSMEKETTNDEASNDVNIKIEIANDDPCDEVSMEKETTNDEASNDVNIKIEIANDDPCDEVSVKKEPINDEASNDISVTKETGNDEASNDSRIKIEDIKREAMPEVSDEVKE